MINTLAKELIFGSIGSTQASRCQGLWFDSRAGQFEHLLHRLFIIFNFSTLLTSAFWYIFSVVW